MVNDLIELFRLGMISVADIKDLAIQAQVQAALNV